MPPSRALAGFWCFVVLTGCVDHGHLGVSGSKCGDGERMDPDSRQCVPEPDADTDAPGDTDPGADLPRDTDRPRDSGVPEDTDDTDRARDTDLPVAEDTDLPIAEDTDDTSAVADTDDTSLVADTDDTSAVADTDDTSLVADTDDTSLVADTDDTSPVADTEDTSVPEETGDTSPLPVPFDVCPGGGAPWWTIQSAMDAAQDGDVIRVCAGTYAPIELTGKRLTVIAVDGRDLTTIRGTMTSPAVLVDGGDLTLVGFTLTGEYSIRGANSVVEAWYAVVTLRHDRIADVTTGTITGALIRGTDSALSIDGLLVEDNRFDGAVLGVGGGSISMEHSIVRRNGPDLGAPPTFASLYKTVVSVRNNLFIDNDVSERAFLVTLALAPSQVSNNVWQGNRASSATSDAIVFLTYDVAFTNNIVADNTNIGGIETWAATPVLIRYNLAYHNLAGANFSFPLAGTGNVELDPRLVDPAHGDLHLSATSPAVDAGDPDPAFLDVDGTRNDMGAYGGPAGAW